MGIKVSKSIKVNVAVAQAFAYVADWRNSPKVQTNFSSFQPVNADELGPGVVVQVKGRFHSLPLSVKMKIVEFEPPRRIVSQVSGMLSSVNAWVFEPLGETQTRVIFANEYRVPAALMALVGGGGFVEREITELTEDALRRLKRLLESKDEI